MDVCKCIVPSWHGGTLNSRRAASPLVRWVEGEERWETPDHPWGILLPNWCGTEKNRTVTCVVLDAKANFYQKLGWAIYESDISIPNFNCIVKYKRPNTRAGGVAIYQNSSDAVNIITPSMECSVSQSDIYGTIQSSVGDLCLAECVIENGQKIIIVAVYITPNKKLDDIIEFLHRSLLPYISRGSALLNKNYDKIPMILSGDFNVIFALDKSLQLIEFLKDNFTVSLQNRIISVTKSNTTSDAVFSRYESDIECKTYISYLSYHKPLITKVCTEAPIIIMEID
ncbi:ATP-dependent DNA helicase [Trichonephila clavipes]|nr:ATP-dependent DNA helicase [Trichonephila clavipes]